MEGRDRARVCKQASWLRWERGKLYITSGDVREIVPPRSRRELVETVSASLGYPGGERLHALLKLRYHWPGMRMDCVRWCALQLPAFLEHTTWRPPQYLHPTNKATTPFHTWCVDLITGLPAGPGGETILVVAICAFSKWIEAAPLPDRSSATLATWMHNAITCRFGVPKIVRTDQGREFRGAFASYLDRVGAHHVLISVAHPRANGLVERANRVIREGIRKMMSACEGGCWVDVLGEILVGTRLLPTRCGWSPFVLVYKQEPRWLADALGDAPGSDGDVPADDSPEAEIAALAVWWERIEEQVRNKHRTNDQRMIEAYEKRADLSPVDLRSMLVPGSRVVMR